MRGQPCTYHPIQEGDTAGQLGPSGTELPKEQTPNGLPFTQAVVIMFCRAEIGGRGLGS